MDQGQYSDLCEKQIVFVHYCNFIGHILCIHGDDFQRPVLHFSAAVFMIVSAVTLWMRRMVWVRRIWKVTVRQSEKVGGRVVL